MIFKIIEVVYIVMAVVEHQMQVRTNIYNSLEDVQCLHVVYIIVGMLAIKSQ
ncbi:MAG: hypothetical protein ACI90V_009222 [Bacillariaceae sp.]|jgi:hypothetical protein